ncbi:N/A [soil metagenome]
MRTPALPPGREVVVPRRGTFYVRELAGPPGAPTVMLLHGWTATADLNYFTCYRELAKHFRVIAFDLRGHGRGLRTRLPFRLSDCADDAAALATELGVDRFIPVGYSMGGPVAQLVWRRHPERVQGLVLCATAAYFAGRRNERVSFLGLTGLAGLARLTPPQAKSWLTQQLYLQRRTDQWEPWASEELARHDWRMVLEAGGSLGRFSSSGWIGEIDVPTAVVLTTADRVVPPRRQLRLAEGIPGARIVRVNADHTAIVSEPRKFVPALMAACLQVATRSSNTTRRRAG